MLRRSFLIVLVVAGNSQAAPQIAGPTGLIPEPGPYAVGVRIVQQYDYSRVLDTPVDAFGKEGNAAPGRPIQTLVWYPAKRAGAAPMQVADYFEVSLSGVDFKMSGADTAKQRARWMSSPQKSLFSAKTLAMRDATPVDGKFPVVIYAPGYAGVAHENMDLCEYLASHGYVVIASRTLAHVRPR